MNLSLGISVIAFAFATENAGEDWTTRAGLLRQQMREALVLPTERVPLSAETHRSLQGEGYTVESVSYASEPNSRVTALLYLPKNRSKPVPAIVVACGHGGSKSCLYAQYAGQLYSKLGFACLAVDTIGEEEREADGRMGARGHDMYHLQDGNPEFVRTKLKRLVLGKIVWDLIRGIDYLETREEIDSERIGIVGYSLGGTTAGCVANLDSRVRAAVICGWVFSERYTTYGKYCTTMPYQAFAEFMDFNEMTALVAPHCATLFHCGDSDDIIDSEENGKAVVRDLETIIPRALDILEKGGVPGTIESIIEKGASHRPLFLTRSSVLWLQEHLMEPGARIPVPEETVPFGEWADSQGHPIEKLYNTEARERSLEAVDIGAVYHDPRELACFPGKVKPDPEYTMEGWVEVTVRENSGRR
jgi:cephalosporin-C deacetylase-like acetyl esterase